MRQIGDESEFFISYQSEFGISREKVLLPSYIVYPGENYQNQNTLYKKGKVLCKVIQSEEGGRFYLNENIYQIILDDSTFEAEEDRFGIFCRYFKRVIKKY